MAGSGLQPTIIALLYLFPGLALFVIAVRFWRKTVDRIFGGDDVLIGLAWILGLGNTIITHLYVVTMRSGYKPEDMPKEPIDWARATKLQYALAVEYNPVICLVKASFLWSLYKLRSRNPWIRYSIIFMQGLNTVYMIATTIVSALSCMPVAKIFDPTVPGKCYDPYQYVLGNVSVVLITDFLVLLIPTAIIWDLQMPLARKLVTVAFLSLGFIVIAIGIARLIWLLNAFQGKVNSYSVESAYSAIECSLAMIGASGPTVKYILSRFIPWLRPSWEKASTKPSNYGYSGGYGANSTNGNTRRTAHNTQRGYDDLDSVSARHEEIEMKNDWQWKSQKDSDAHSDEQRITDPHDGIVKSVEWTVSTRDEATIGMARGSDGRHAVQPANVV